MQNERNYVNGILCFHLFASLYGSSGAMYWKVCRVCILDERLKQFRDEKCQLEDENRRLKQQLEEEKEKERNGREIRITEARISN